MSYPNFSAFSNGYIPNQVYPQSYTPSYQPLGRTQIPPQPQNAPLFQEVKYVTDAQAEAYMVDPNCKVMLIDKENQIFWIKWADAMGQQYNEKFKFESLNTQNQAKNQDSMADFVKQKDFEDILGKLNERLNQFEMQLKGKNEPVMTNS